MRANIQMTMFDRRIDRLFQEMMRDPVAPKMMQTPFRQGLDAEGYKVEVVDGERTEYIYEDGEWHEVGADTSDDDESPFDVRSTKTQTELTLDIHQFDDLRGFGAEEVEASLNNGILEISFHHSVEDEDGSEE